MQAKPGAIGGRATAAALHRTMLPRVMLLGAMLLGAMLVMAGCSDRSVLSPREEKLGIDDSALREFHSTLYFPKGVGLRYHGYVVGLQKSERARIAAPGDFNDSERSFLRPRVGYFEAEAAADKAFGLGTQEHVLQKLQSDPKTFFVAHVTSHWISNRGFPRADECFIYNALRSPHLNEHDGDDLSSGLAWKSCAARFREDRSTATVPDWNGKPLGNAEFYRNGVPALKSLEAAIAHDLAQVSVVRDAAGREVSKNTYTHVLLIVMGWNTAQQEAVRNMNDLAGNMMAAAEEAQARGAGGEFRPLVVGLTWPSYWSTSALNAFSYTNKANDADEVGLSWLNLLMNETLPNAIARSKTPLVVIGHSFGARAASRALFSAPALRLTPNEPERPLASKVDLLVALQGAFSVNRFKSGAGAEGAPYRDFARLPTRIMLTTSKWDAAAGGPVFWYDPAGKIESYAKVCNGVPPWEKKDIWWCMTASESPARNGDGPGNSSETDGGYPKSGFNLCDPTGKCLCPARDRTCRGTQNIAALAAPREKRLFYVDVSDHITQYNSPGSNGVAHSDIYRLSTGRLIWSMLNLP